MSPAKSKYDNILVIYNNTNVVSQIKYLNLTNLCAAHGPHLTKEQCDKYRHRSTNSDTDVFGTVRCK